MTTRRRQRSAVSWRAFGDTGILVLALVVDLVLWGLDGRLRPGGHVPVPLVVASAVAVFALLRFRGRWPRAAYVVAWSYCLVWGALLVSYQPFTALVIALHHIARHLPLRSAIWFLLLAAVPPAISTRDAANELDANASGVVFTAMLWCVIIGLAWTVGRSGRRTAQAVRWREAKVAAEAALALQDERMTLARELHDIVAHSVGAILMQAAGAQRVAGTDRERALLSLGVIEDCATRAMRELRDLLGMLHSAGDGQADAAPAQLSLADVGQLVELTRAGGVRVDLDKSGMPGRLTGAADHAAYRLVQEALSNAVKHGGREVQVRVQICWQPDQVEITVRSQSPAEGAAAQASSTGYGLAGMRYRVVSVGGTVESGWQPGHAFCVQARIPVVGAVANGLRTTTSDGGSA